MNSRFIDIFKKLKFHIILGGHVPHQHHHHHHQHHRHQKNILKITNTIINIIITKKISSMWNKSHQHHHQHHHHQHQISSKVLSRFDVAHLPSVRLSVLLSFVHLPSVLPSVHPSVLLMDSKINNH